MRGSWCIHRYVAENWLVILWFNHVSITFQLSRLVHITTFQPHGDFAPRIRETPLGYLGGSRNGDTPIAGWCIMENRIKMDDLGVPPWMGKLHFNRSMDFLDRSGVSWGLWLRNRLPSPSRNHPANAIKPILRKPYIFLCFPACWVNLGLVSQWAQFLSWEQTPNKPSKTF